MNLRKGVDYVTRDYEGFRQELLQLLKKKIPQYSDFSQSDAGVVLIELLSHGLDIVSYYNDKIANEVFPDTAVERGSMIKHCRRLGYELRNAIPSRYEQVFKIIPQDTPYLIPVGFTIETKGEDVLTFETIDDLVIPEGCTGMEKDEHGNYLYSVIVEQGETISGEIVGSSNGQAYQEFFLSYKPIIIESLQIFVRDENTYEEWEKVSNFIDSDSESKNFIVEVNESDDVKIEFGSGKTGAIPPIYDNGISANYRVGGGEEGNVALEMITEMPQKPSVIVETFNVKQVQIGRDKEDLEEAKTLAPINIKTPWRAVSLVDYENLLKIEFRDEICRVKAIAEEDKCTVSVYVLMRDDHITLESRKQTFAHFLDERKEIGYTVNIYPPTFENVTLTVQVTTTKSFFNKDVKDSVEGTLQNELQQVDSFDFGEPLLVSNVIREVMSLSGVRDLNVQTTGNLKPAENKIVKITNITVEVQGGI